MQNQTSQVILVDSRPTFVDDQSTPLTPGQIGVLAFLGTGLAMTLIYAVMLAFTQD